MAFAKALPRIRSRVDADLELPGLPRDKILALVVRLLELTLVRVGNEEYARLNRSFGLTTLRDRHATVGSTGLRFRFRGKGGQMREVAVRDRRLARLVGRCQDIPGQELFQYVDDDGSAHGVDSDDVNAYLREASGADVTAKMFRTWAATVLACRALGALVVQEEAMEPSASEPAPTAAAASRVARRQVVAAMRTVADRLGNTPAVARESYVHPDVVDAYLDGSLGRALVRATEDAGEALAPSPAEERAVIRLLERAPARRRRSSGRGST